MSRTVRKDNTVLFRSNRYSLPLGTFNTQKTVDFEVEGEQLKIYTTTGDLLAEHLLCQDKGKLIKADAHRYERDQKTRERLDKAVSLLRQIFQNIGRC